MLVVAAVMVVGCSGHRHDDKMMFRYNESAGITTLDPAFAKDQALTWACRQLYNGLVQLDSALQVQPWFGRKLKVLSPM